jgi:hypothetical protein
VNLLGQNIGIINKKNRNCNSIREGGLEINVDKAKYMLVSRHRNSSQYRDMKIGNRLSENVSKFKYLGTTVTNQNLTQEEIKRRLNSSNTCFSPEPSVSLSAVKDFKVRIYRVLILSVVLF